MAERITIDELKSYLWQSAVLLRTHIDAGAYKQYIFPLMFFKRICDVYDEETAKAVEEYGEDMEFYPEEELHTFLVPKGYHWNDVRQVTEDVGAAIVKAFREIEKANGDKMTGIFGDGAWTNKNRLPDRLLKDLLEHFSSKCLSLANCPEDELGQGYEYLIKQFADDSGHTAQEFYTNRTVVHLMTEMLQPQSGESVYDPTCGSAGMLISCIAHLKAQGKEWRNLRIYGQEINQLTSAIGRMNLFLHGIEDFHIVNDDTLKNPAFIENGQLQQFDLVLANPPYSISQWDRAAFEVDKYGRNLYGTPPQSRADYAFIQHIIASLAPDTGRAAILLPHGVLNRKEEAEIRKAIVQSDCIDAVIGLGRHLFYNSGLESCILLLRKNKPLGHRNNILFIEAEKCTHKVQAQNYLFDDDIRKIVDAYFADTDIPDFSRRVTLEEIIDNDGNLNIKLYVNSDVSADEGDFADNLDAYLSSSSAAHFAYAQFEPQEVSEEDGGVVSFEPFDKANWKRVRLADVAEEYSARVDEPSQSEYEWYIGSDCIDGFGFRIVRRQSTEKIHSAQKLFKNGDYLLVRRSLYGSDFRERAPRADFDGVCSADILTIREKKGLIADGYLIAVLYSKRLWDFIVSNSTGSLTRRIKWNQLKDFEFDLPPIELQEKLSALLWSMERAKDSYRSLIAKTDELVKSQFVEMFGTFPANEHSWPVGTIRDGVMDVRYGSSRKAAEGNNGQYPYLRMNNITYSGELDLSDVKTIDIPDDELDKCSVRRGDVLFNRTNSRELVGKTCVYNRDELMVLAGFVVRVRVNDRLLPEFLSAFMNTDFTKTLLLSMCKAAIGQANINATEFQNIGIYFPPIEHQQEFVQMKAQADKSKFAAQQALADLTATQKALMRQYLG